MTLPNTDSIETATISLEPGFFSEQTARGAKSRWKDGNRVRFKDGLPQKMGGWATQAISNTLLPTPTFQGVDRRELEWTTLDSSKWLAQGTSKKLYLVANNVRYDITPVRRTVTLTGPFTTLNASPLVTVADQSHGAARGDFVRFTGATAVGGLTVDGEYAITTVNDGNSYVITASGNASSGASGGGSVVTTYDISIGFDSTTQATGWGTCTYGTSTYGTRRGACSGVTIPLRTWSLDNWGEDLLACPRGGGIYWWDKTTGPLARAVLLPDAPPTNQFMLVSDSGDQVICLGAFDSVANSSDPMLIRTSDIGSLTVFTINDSVNNAQANSVFEERLSTGSRIINGIRTRNGIFIFTDKAQYLMQPDSSQIYRVGKLAEGSSVLGPNAAIEVDGTMYGMGRNRFVKFDGVFQEMPCPVWGKLFDNRDIPATATNSSGDPYFDSVVMQCHFDGTNGQTTATDSSGYGRALSNVYGGSLCDTTTYKWPTGSLPAPIGVPKSVSSGPMSGGSQYTGSNQELAVSAGAPFTIEGWVNVDATGVGSQSVLFTVEGDYGTGRPAVMVYFSGASVSTMKMNALGYRDGATTAFLINGTTNFSCNTWHHVALVRSGTTYTIYLDGVADGSVTSAITLSTSTGGGVASIGAQRSVAYMVGWIDDFRFTNGVARYTSNFAVPTAAFPNIGSNVGTPAMLLHMDGSFQDSAFPPNAMSVSGATTETYNVKFGSGAGLFSNPAQTIPATVTTPVVSGSNLDITSGDFTIDGWLYQTAYPISQSMVFEYSAPDFTYGFRLYSLSSGSLAIQGFGGIPSVSTTGSIPFNTWTHFAVTRFKNVLRIYLNGVTDANGYSNTMPASFGLPSVMWVGAGALAVGQHTWWQGFMDEFRVTKGAALYANNFTPPTSAPSDPPAAYGINNVQTDKVYCWYNKDFSEVWWHYPSSQSTENDRYIILNINEAIWYYGAINRSAGSSGGTAYNVPFATDSTGVLYLHETGANDDGAPLGDYIESYDIQIGTGKAAVHVRNFVPDMKRIAGTLQLLLKAKNRPQQSSYVVSGPYNFTGSSTLQGVRACGRQMALRVASTGVSSDWRMGDSTFEMQPDGER